MRSVQFAPFWWLALGLVALGAVALVTPLSTGGWIAGGGYLIASTMLVSRGLGRRRARRFGPANAVTITRSTLVGLITALAVTALIGPAGVVFSGAPAWLVAVAPPAYAAYAAHAVMPGLLVALAVPALALDAVDGWVARRTRTVTELGGRFDMEVDAFLLLVLSCYVAPILGAWVLSIGLMRYAFVVAGRLVPFLRSPLPRRYWRKVVTAACGIALVLAASALVSPVLSALAVVIALALLVESFGRDTVWLVTRAPAARLRAVRWRIGVPRR